MEVGAELSTKRARAESGTSGVGVFDSALPMEASRDPGLAETAAAAPVAVPVGLLAAVPAAGAARAGT